MFNIATKQRLDSEEATFISGYHNIEGIDEPILIVKESDCDEFMSSGRLPDDHLVVRSEEGKEITADVVRTWQKFVPGIQIVIVISTKSDNPEIPISSAMKINI